MLVSPDSESSRSGSKDLNDQVMNQLTNGLNRLTATTKAMLPKTTASRLTFGMMDSSISRGKSCCREQYLEEMASSQEHDPEKGEDGYKGS